MDTRKQIHEEDFPVAPERLFAILHTPSAIRDWWSVSRSIVMPESGGYWVATWGEDEDDPDYISLARILEFDPPRRMLLGDYQYRIKAGSLPFDADFRIEFLVEPHGEGSRLRITQDGFPTDPVADDFFAGCQQGWKDTIAGIRRHLEG